MGTLLDNRISGLVMSILIGTKLISGLYLLPEEKPEWAMSLHRQTVLDIMLIFLLCLHACFGLKTILFEIGLFKEKVLAYAATILSLVLAVISVIVYMWLA